MLKRFTLLTWVLLATGIMTLISLFIKNTALRFLKRYRFRYALLLVSGLLTNAYTASGQSLTFGPPVSYSSGSGSQPWGLAVADVNGDGKPDVLTANYGSNTAGVLLSTGTGTLQSVTTYAAGTGTGPFGVAAADLNGDGRLDLVTANFNHSTSTLFGAPGGGFLAPTVYGAGNNSSPRVVAVADVNADGKPDVLTANAGSGTVGVLLNSGTGTLQPVVTYSIGTASGTDGIVVADINADNKPDLLASNSSNSTVAVLLGNGNGTFQAVVTYAAGGTGSATTTLAVADLNGDGKPDIVAGNSGNGTAGVLLGNGNGTFQAATTYSAGGAPTAVAVADMNADGKADILTANYTSGSVGTLLGNGNGTFQAVALKPVGAPYRVAAADFNNDGWSDIVTVSPGGSVSVLRNTSSSPTLTALSPQIGPPGTILTLTGTNLTGTTSIAFTGNTVTSGFTVNAAGTQITGVVVPSGAITGNITVSTSFGTSNGLTFTVTAPLTITSTSPTANVRAASATGPVSVTFNQAISSGSTAALKVFSQQRGGLRSGSSGTTTVSGSTVSFAPTYAWLPGETVQATVTTAATSNGGGTLTTPRVWQFTTAVSGGTGTFGGGSNPAVGSLPFSVAAADVNNDGYPDVLAASANSNTVSVRINNGSGAFSGTTNVSVGARPFGVVAADVNGDGILDLLTANQNANTASICLGSGNGTFGAATSVTVGSGPWGVTAADVDGDGDLDLLTANHSTNTVSVRLNNGSGVFTGTTTVPVGNNPFCVVATDVDNDGDLDLLTANEGSSTASVRINNGSGAFSGTTELPVGAAPQSVVAADFNGDGALDVATANHGGNNLSVLLNNGRGTFGAATSVSSGAYACGVVAADVDGDGDLDLLSTNFQANTVSVRINNGSGSFSGIGNLSVGSGPIVIITTDVDGDGDLDFLTANQTANAVSVRFNQNASFPDLVISTGTLQSPATVPAGTYNSLTVMGNSVAQLAGNTVVNNVVTVNGTLLTNCQLLTGAASFTLTAGATVGICDPAGLSSTTGTGAVRTTGPRSFSTAASYLYNGTAAQTTGNALPDQVLNLTTTNAQLLTLSQPVRVQQVVTVGGAGNLVLNGQALTLLSDASGTALVVNSGTGVVQGSTGTMQRYIDASGNSGASGYRHYSTPVSGTTVADLATGTFAPTLNQLYNTSTTPTAVQPFPTVFGYDETRLASSPATGLSEFDKGWFSPAAPTDPLAVGRGYTVQLGNAELVDFTGTFVTGSRTLGGLTRGSRADAGWHLVGNPYPAPLDWSTVTSGQLTAVNPAIYIHQSTGPYAGRYRTLVNGIGAGSSLIPAGQAFFVRASMAGATGSIALTNANRATTFAGQPALQRSNDPRPRLRLSLGVGSQPTTPATAVDEAFVYLQAGATTAFDGAYDADKLANPNGFYLASTSTDAVPLGLSINGRPLPGTTDEVIPLWLSAPAGAYTLTATELVNFATPNSALMPYLRDALTGTFTDLSRQASYSFAVAAGAPYAGRFALVLRPAGVLTTSPGSPLAGTLASLYPNPTAAETTLSATGLPASAATLEAVLLDAVGREVGRYVLPVRKGAARQSLSATGLSTGLYLLRLTARDAQSRPLGSLRGQRLVVR